MTEQVVNTVALQLAPQLPEDFTEAGQVLAALDELRHWRAGKPIKRRAEVGNYSSEAASRN